MQRNASSTKIEQLSIMIKKYELKEQRIKAYWIKFYPQQYKRQGKVPTNINNSLGSCKS